MLSQFTVENYKSFLYPATLDLHAVSLTEHKDHLIAQPDGEAMLPVAVLYGPNGGGKTNLLDALYALIYKVTAPIFVASQPETTPSSPPMKIMPFLFDPEAKEQPTKYELYFYTDKAEYQYSLQIKEDEIRQESLSMKKFDTRRITHLFERQGTDISMKGPLRTKKISKEISPRIPLLSFLAINYGNNEHIKDAASWFQNKVQFLSCGYKDQTLKINPRWLKTNKSHFLKILQEMGIEIHDIRLEQKEDHIRIHTLHQLPGQETELELGFESQGTQKLFYLIPLILDTLSSGGILTADELDAKIHPRLLAYIIQLFTNKESNPKGAQLIFNSHDLATMNNQLFRRDEIWFTAKGNRQDSQLYALSDFKTETGTCIRKDASYAKQYLEGKYGADPYLQKIIQWEEVHHAKKEE